MPSCVRVAAWFVLGLVPPLTGCSPSAPEARPKGGAPVAEHPADAIGKPEGSRSESGGLGPNLDKTPAEVARREWLNEGNPARREAVIEQIKQRQLEDPLRDDLQLMQEFNQRKSDLLKRYANVFPRDFRPLRQLRAYFDAHEFQPHAGQWKRGKRPSLKLVDVIDEELRLASVLTVARRNRSLHKEDADKLDEGLRKSLEGIQERGAAHIADAIAADTRLAPRDPERRAKEEAALDALLDDPADRARLGLAAAACVAFRDLVAARMPPPPAAEGAEQIENAMRHWGRASDDERRALRTPAERERFLGDPQTWMDRFLSGQSDTEPILASRAANARLHHALGEKYPPVCPLGRPE